MASNEDTEPTDNRNQGQEPTQIEPALVVTGLSSVWTSLIVLSDLAAALPFGKPFLNHLIERRVELSHLFISPDGDADMLGPFGPTVAGQHNFLRCHGLADLHAGHTLHRHHEEI